MICLLASLLVYVFVSFFRLSSYDVDLSVSLPTRDMIFISTLHTRPKELLLIFSFNSPVILSVVHLQLISSRKVYPTSM